MKKQVYQLLGMIAMLAAGLSLQSCEDHCEETVTYVKRTPIYMLPAEIRSSIQSEAPQPLKDPGKIYMYGDWIFINERWKGIHVIDNSNPENPQNIAFFNIPGNVDMAAKGNILYADSYTDLLCLDISSPANIAVASRIDNAFPMNSQHGYWSDPELGIMVDYKEEEVTETVSCEEISGIRECWLGACDDEANFDVASGGGGGTPSRGGSMARFTLSNDHLYTVSDMELHPFRLTTPTTPEPLSTIEFDWGVETIFPYRNHLFLGTRTGMHIVNVENPSSPEHISTYEHIQSCDPVVVQDDYAYVTLRGGSACGGFENQLEVIDVSNLRSPQLKKVYPMLNPHGLGIDGNCLFICEGEFGLKYLDAENPMDIQLKAFFESFHAYDVIPFQNRLLVIGQDGLYQYTYDCETEPRLISMIPIQRAD